MVNYRFDAFKKFKQFDTISMIELENVYQELIGELKKDDWSVSTDKFEKKAVNEKKYIYNSFLASKVENGLQTNIGLNLNDKTVWRDFYENGSFVIYFLLYSQENYHIYISFHSQVFFQTCLPIHSNHLF